MPVSNWLALAALFIPSLGWLAWEWRRFATLSEAREFGYTDGRNGLTRIGLHTWSDDELAAYAEGVKAGEADAFRFMLTLVPRA